MCTFIKVILSLRGQMVEKDEWKGRQMIEQRDQGKVGMYKMLFV